VERWNTLQRSHTWVIEFANKSHTRVGIDNESAKEQFSRYLLFQQYWTDHNTSITINFAPDEVESLVDMILEHWDAYIAVSFLPKDIRTYPLLPEEPITEEEYNARVIHISPDMLQHSLQQYEFTDLASDLLDPSCDTGICPVR
jgi:ribonucleoside-diphosphate reductase alpha chain